MHGPTREHVDGDPYDGDPRVVMPFSGMSPSGDVEADVVYANYGTPEDFEKLEKLKIDVRGKGSCWCAMARTSAELRYWWLRNMARPE